VAGLCIWNMVPALLRLVNNCVHFKCLLKAHCLIEAAALSDFFVLHHCLNSLGYLLTYLLTYNRLCQSVNIQQPNLQR